MKKPDNKKKDRRGAFSSMKSSQQKGQIRKKDILRSTVDLFQQEPDKFFNYKQIAANIGLKTMAQKQQLVTMLTKLVEEDFILESPYTWNVDDAVSLSIPSSLIKIHLKGDISKYVRED